MESGGEVVAGRDWSEGEWASVRAEVGREVGTWVERGREGD